MEIRGKSILGERTESASAQRRSQVWGGSGTRGVPCQVGSGRDEVRDVRWKCHLTAMGRCHFLFILLLCEAQTERGQGLKQGPVRRITSLNEE